MQASEQWSGKVAVVTGGAGDIGIAIAGRLLQAGVRVALFDQRQAALEAAAERLARPAWLLTIAGDIADPIQSPATVDAVTQAWGRIDMLINNAATDTPMATIGDLDVDAWRRTLDVNLTGAWLMCRACLPVMIAGGGGVVLNIASQLGRVAASGRGAYSVSKAALIALARAIAIDHAAAGIRAVSLSPGAIMTGRLIDRYGDPAAVRERLADRYPLGRIGTVTEVAAAAMFLLSDDASFMTGTDLLLDGGYTAV